MKSTLALINYVKKSLPDCRIMVCDTDDNGISLHARKPDGRQHGMSFTADDINRSIDESLMPMGFVMSAERYFKENPA